MSDARYRPGQTVDGRVICGAKTRSGSPCKQNPITGRERCRMHGGKTPRGPDLPQTKHGRFSKDLPTRMVATYEEALADDDLLTLREEIAVVTAREGDLLKRVDTGESGEMWSHLRDAWADLQAARRANDQARAAESFQRIAALIEQAEDDYQAWRELRQTIEQRRRLVDTERRRLVDLRQMITHERAILFASALLDAVRRNVDDRDALARISADFQRLLHAGAPDADAGARGADR